MTTIRDTNLSQSLDLTGKTLLLPTAVDYIVEADTAAEFPQTGRAQRLYIDRSSGLPYRWDGTAYTPAADLPSSFSPTPPANPYQGQRWTDTFDLTTYEWFVNAWVEKPNNQQ